MSYDVFNTHVWPAQRSPIVRIHITSFVSCAIISLLSHCFYRGGVANRRKPDRSTREGFSLSFAGVVCYIVVGFIILFIIITFFFIVDTGVINTGHRYHTHLIRFFKNFFKFLLFNFVKNTEVHTRTLMYTS